MTFFVNSLNWAMNHWVIFFVAFAIVALISFSRANRRKARLRQEASGRANAERQAEEARKRRDENDRRKTLRAEWLKAHKLLLYINTQRGLTAVMTPQAVKKLEAWTARQITNGYWLRNGLFSPTDGSAPTYLFVTKQGWELLEKNTTREIAKYKKMGMLADLHDLVREYDIELVEDKRIFVPFLEGTVLPFKDQLVAFPDGANRSAVKELVYNQFPAELQPLS